MERISSINQADVERQRDRLRELEAGYETPCPGSRLKLDDDVLWLGFVNARVVWGHPNSQAFYGYAPDIFGDVVVPLDIGYVGDRAPADSSEEPLPIYPQQQLAQQPGARDAHAARQPKKPDANETKKVLQDLLKSLPPENAKRAREYIRTNHPEIQLPEST